MSGQKTGLVSGSTATKTCYFYLNPHPQQLKAKEVLPFKQLRGCMPVLRVPWTARRFNQSILKEISPEYSLEKLMLKLKLQYFGHLMRRTDSFEKTLMMERLKMGGEGEDRG